MVFDFGFVVFGGIDCLLSKDIDPSDMALINSWRFRLNILVVLIMALLGLHKYCRKTIPANFSVTSSTSFYSKHFVLLIRNTQNVYSKSIILHRKY